MLTVEPTNAQAWLTKASILQVQTRYDEARRACQRLARLAASHVLLGCLSDIAGVTGQSAKSRELLRQVLSDAALSGRERIWIATILAETAARTEAIREAEQYFTEAFRVGIKDQYLLGAYADFLLDQGRYRDVVPLSSMRSKPMDYYCVLCLQNRHWTYPGSRTIRPNSHPDFLPAESEEPPRMSERKRGSRSPYCTMLNERCP